MALKIPISLTLSKTEPSIVFKTINAAINTGIKTLLNPFDALDPIEL